MGDGEKSLGLPIKQQAGALSPSSESLLYGESYPVRPEGTRQTVWLNLDGPRSEKSRYREGIVSEEPLCTDGAIFRTGGSGGTADRPISPSQGPPRGGEQKEGCRRHIECLLLGGAVLLDAGPP